jgi:mannonate dehydratase
MKRKALSKPRTAEAASEQPAKPLMYPTTKRFSVTDEDLLFLQRYGVKTKTAQPTFTPGKGWDLDEILRMKDKALEYDINIDSLELPFERDVFLKDGYAVPQFMLNESDEAERELDLVCEMIRTASKASIRVLIFCIKQIENQSTASTTGRGGARCRTWDITQADNKPRYEKTVTADETWARVSHFLERVIPVAAEYNVQMGNHPGDCWLPSGFKGIERIMSDFEDTKKYIELYPSPYNGLQFCLGTMAESCVDPATEIYDIVRYFAERKKIFCMDFRNIVGGRNHFMEVFPDEGVIDMHRVMRILYDAGYAYGIDPDHFPCKRDDDPGCRQSAAYHYGYINALIQSL